MKTKWLWPAQGRRTDRRAAFTLIELLMVMGIIMLLAALVIPGIRSVMEKGREAKCQSNLRSIASAVMLYAVDHDGIIPVAGLEWNTQYLQLTALHPYLRDYALFHCPSAVSENTGLNFPQQQTVINGVTRYSDYKLNDHEAYVTNRMSRFHDTAWVVVALDNDWGPARHKDGEHFAFLAGHVEHYTRDESAGEDPYGNEEWFRWGIYPPP